MYKAFSNIQSWMKEMIVFMGFFSLIYNVYFMKKLMNNLHYLKISYLKQLLKTDMLMAHAG